jgi:aryl-alcohol dehydrogenase-like predicted oxidoreductase
MVKTYLNPATQARAERILTVSALTGISPTAVSLAYLLHDQKIKTYPILGISRIGRLDEAFSVFDLDDTALRLLFE